MRPVPVVSGTGFRKGEVKLIIARPCLSADLENLFPQWPDLENQPSAECDEHEMQAERGEGNERRMQCPKTGFMSVKYWIKQVPFDGVNAIGNQAVATEEVKNALKERCFPMAP